MLSQNEIEAQLGLLATHRDRLRLLLRQYAFIGVAHAPPALLMDINAARADIHRIKTTLRTNGVEVADAPDDEQPSDSHHELSLPQALTHHLTQSDLQAICWSFSVDYESLPGDTSNDKNVQLIQKLQNESRLRSFIDTCNARYPEIKWNALYDTYINKRDPSVFAKQVRNMVVVAIAGVIVVIPLSYLLGSVLVAGAIIGALVAAMLIAIVHHDS